MKIIENVISRRGFLRGTAVGSLGLAAAAVIGCGEDEAAGPAAKVSATPAAAAPETSKPVEKKAAPAAAPAKPAVKKVAHMNFGSRTVMPTMSPNTTAASNGEFHAVYDCLTRQRPTDTSNSIDAGLATSWETPDGKGKKWIFKLREAEWSDGKKFTSADVKFVHDYYKDAENKSRLISRVKTYESSKIIDDQTIEITCAASGDPLFPKREAIVLQIPKHIYEDASINAEEFMGSTPVGTGAYTTKDYIQAQQVELVKSPSTWHTNKGFETVSYKWVLEQATRVAAFETGELDFIMGVPLIDYTRVGGFKDSIAVQPPANTNVAWDMANMPDKDPSITNDPRVRQAVNYALDREGLIMAAFDGVSRPAKDQLITPNVFGHQADYVAPAYDPDKARQLMKDAGLGSGAKMRVDAQIITFPPLKSMLEASIGLWKDIGIDSDVRTIEVNVWRDRLYGRETQGRPGAFLMGWSSFLYEAGLAWGWHGSDNPYALWKNKAFDDARDMANAAVDPVDRMKYYRLMAEQEKVENGGPSAFVAENTNAYAFYGNVLDASTYTAWTAPEIYFNEVKPA
ncbi:MAG: ABC-type transport system, substrate-binding protein [Chloroflexi bacterium]|nr:MAG: ABC-type transport system, substrate-binding protein [Chloroflexota bacterium]